MITVPPIEQGLDIDTEATPGLSIVVFGEGLYTAGELRRGLLGAKICGKNWLRSKTVAPLSGFADAGSTNISDVCALI